LAETAFFESLFQKRVGGIKPGLERMQRAYKILGEPAREIPTLLIGGTNGKGSTAGYLFGFLASCGIATGLYTSPHLRFFRERYQMSHGVVSDESLVARVKTMQERLPADLYEELSFFEIATLLAFQVFADQRCEVMILEVGLGGRLDATNICDPWASVIVSISRDHEAFLGNSLASIAEEKLGIARSDRPLFWGAGGEIEQDTEALAAFVGRAEQASGTLIARGESFERQGSQLVLAKDGPTDPVRVDLPPLITHEPSFLQDNFSLALAVYHRLSTASDSAVARFPWLSLQDLLTKLVNAGLPTVYTMQGRFQQRTIQWEGRDCEILLDVCHNPDGVRVLAQSLADRGYDKPPALVSILRDKHVNEMLDQLRSVVGPLVLFEIDDPRTWTKKDLADRHQDLPCFETFLKAWRYAHKMWHNPSLPWLICGSVLVVGRVLDAFNHQSHETPQDDTLS
jgi:dihydrofolate synthase/folylpolyglutamate synthase